MRWDEGPEVAGEGARGPFAPYRQMRAPEPLRGLRRSSCSTRTWPIPATARRRSSTAERERQEAAKLPPRYSGRCASLTPDGAGAPSRRRAARPALRFRVGEGVVAWDDIVRGHDRDRRRQHRRRLRDRPRGRDAALPLRGRRRRRGHGDDPHHPRRGPHLEHAQAHPAVPGARPRGPAVRPPAAHPQRRPDEDEQAQEPDRDRRLPRGGLHPRGARQLPGPARLVDRHRGRDPLDRRDRRAVRHRRRQQGRRGLRSRPPRVAQRPVDPPPRARRPGRAAAAVPRRPSSRPAGSTGCPSDEEVRALLPVVQERLPRLGAIGELVGFLWVDELASTRRRSCRSAGTRRRPPRRSRRPATTIADVGAVSFEADELEPPLRALAEERGWKAGDLFMAIRVAVTGRTATPPLFDTLVALGYERTLERLDRAIDAVATNPAGATAEPDAAVAGSDRQHRASPTRTGDHDEPIQRPGLARALLGRLGDATTPTRSARSSPPKPTTATTRTTRTTRRSAGRDAITSELARGPRRRRHLRRHYEPYAVEGDRAVAVGWSRYYTDASKAKLEREYRNAYLLAFDAEGRCTLFTEFFMETPAQFLHAS